MPLKTCLVKRDLNVISNLKREAIKKMAKVTTIFLLYILVFYTRRRTYLYQTLFILRGEEGEASGAWSSIPRNIL